MKLSPMSKRRLAYLIEWIKQDREVSNAQLAVTIRCSSSTISDWLNLKRCELRPHLIEKLAAYLAVNESDILEVVQEESPLPLHRRIELMRASRNDNQFWSSSVTVEEFIKKLYLLPTSQLPMVIEAAVDRLDNSLVKDCGGSNVMVSIMLSQQHRIKLSKLVLISAHYREQMGGHYAQDLEDILKKTRFLRQILDARGNDFFIGITGGLCSIEDHVQDALLKLCFQAGWRENGEPILLDPPCKYDCFAHLVKDLSEERSTSKVPIQLGYDS